MTIKNRPRTVSAVLLTFATLVLASSTLAQGPAQRVGQGLDNAGKNIRRGVEGAVVRGQVSAFEKDLLARVYHRVHWDTRLVNSSMQIVVQANGSVILRGAVSDDAAKQRAIDLTQTTVGVTAVVDELVLAKAVIFVPAAKPVIEVPAAVIVEPAPTVIIKP